MSLDEMIRFLESKPPANVENVLNAWRFHIDITVYEEIWRSEY